MLLKLVLKLLEKPGTYYDNRSQIQASRINQQIIIHRYGGIQFWWDLDAGLRQFCMATTAEVRAYNQVLKALESDTHFIKHGIAVYYSEANNLWTSQAWSQKGFKNETLGN